MGKKTKTVQLLSTGGNVAGWKIVRAEIGWGIVEPINLNFEVTNGKETIESWEGTAEI